jgi:predicted AAA+ superfamily ATPase
MDYISGRKNTAPVTKDAGALWRAIFNGSFPAVVTGWTERAAFYDAYIKTYIERDVRALSQVGDEIAFMRFIGITASRTGQMLNYHDLSKDAGISEPTAKKWLSILAATGLVYLLRPFAVNVEKRLVKTPKLYFMDTGLAAYLCRWTSPEVLSAGAVAGAFFETFVVSEIIKSYANRGIEAPLYFWRDKEQREIDLVFWKDGTLYPVEIKKTATPKADDVHHFSILDAVPGCKRGEGCLICTCAAPAILAKGVYALPAGYL